MIQSIKSDPKKRRFTANLLSVLFLIGFTIAVLAIVLISEALFGALFPVHAGGVGRCSSFYSAPVYTYAQPAYVVAPQVVKQEYPKQTITVNNIYPQGSTVYGSTGQYGVAQVSQLSFTNPSLGITVAGNAIEKLTGVLQSSVTEANVNNQAIANVATIQSATDHLRAVAAIVAESNGNGSPKQITLQIGDQKYTMQAHGNVQNGVRAEASISQGVSSGNNNQSEVASSQSILTAKCASCHGSQLSEPQGGIYVGPDITLSDKQAMRTLDILAGNDIPEKMKTLVTSLTAEEKGRLMEEILTVWRKPANPAGGNE